MIPGFTTDREVNGNFWESQEFPKALASDSI
jgi:hypothetical protein